MASSVVFATPSFSHSVVLDYHKSMIETVGLLLARGVSPGFVHRGGDQFIAKARNKLVWQFLTEHEAENLFFIDDDVGWPAEKVLEFLDRPEPILMGCYPPRQDKLDWPGVGVWVEDGKLQERNGLVRLVNGPAGFLRIKRQVFEVMLAAKGEQGAVPWFRDMEPGGEPKDYPGIFNTGIGPDGWYWGEDIAFCRNAGACGFEVWCDPDISFTHRGPKTWSGKLKDSLPTFRKRARTFAKEQQRTSEAA